LQYVKKKLSVYKNVIVLYRFVQLLFATLIQLKLKNMFTAKLRITTINGNSRYWLPILIILVLTAPLCFSQFHTPTGSKGITQDTSANEILTLYFYDIDASQQLSHARISHITDHLKQTDSDIIILAGVKNKEELQKIKSCLSGFSYSQIINGADTSSHLAYLSKKEPESFQAVTDLKYVIKKGIELPIQRGFIHAVIKKNNYKLHILGADLKNRNKHPLYNQTDMRRYEARKLRHYATAIIKKEKEPNILILADLNDSCGKSPVKAIYNRRFGIKKRLFDLRPLDKIQVSWTYLSKERDEYERIDYAIVSSPLIPEVIIEKTRIIDNSDWQKASSHRPIVVSISCIDRPLWTKDKINTIFPHAIRTPEYVKSSKAIGEKRKRGVSNLNQ